MKKLVYRSEFGKNSKDFHVGYLPGYKWMNVSWNYPTKPGRYLVINHCGQLMELYCSGNADKDERPNIFDQAADTGYGSTAYIDDREMTDSDLMSLYRNPSNVWYYFEQWHEYEDWFSDLHIVTQDNPTYPLYYLDLELENTSFEIDSNGELEAEEKPIFVDLEGTIKKEDSNAEKLS